MSKNNRNAMNVLLTNDGSPQSRVASQFLQNLTFPPDTSLYLLKVIDGTDTQRSGPTEHSIKSFQTQEMNNAWELTKQESQKLETSIRPITPLVARGIPGGAILTAIDKHHIDLVVLGTHGRKGLNRFLLGSVSEWVLSEAPCSTLIVRPKTHVVKSKTKGLRILFASDGSPDARAAVTLLHLIDFPQSSRLTILHVVKKHFYQTGQLITTTRQTPTAMDKVAKDLLQERGRRGSQLLHDIQTKFADKGWNVNEHLAFGSEADEILKCAKRTRADLIVLGSRGTTNMRKLLLGGVSNKVVRHAPCSVLVVRKSRQSNRSK
ncbi:MAG: universal stress protein [Nitrospirales bacterium]